MSSGFKDYERQYNPNNLMNIVSVCDCEGGRVRD